MKRTSKTVEISEWIMQEAGWYTHAVLGGLARRNDNLWYFYPLKISITLGPFRSLRAAKKAAERWLKS